YDYGIETITNKNQLECEMTEFILGIRQINTNKKYALLSLINCIKLLSKVLNVKIKKLKKDGIVSHHHDHLTETELRTIFQHNLVSSNTPQGLQYWNSWYLDERLDDKTCRSFIKTICITVGINIGNCDIVNHSDQSTLITFLFQKEVPIDTLSLLIDSVETLPSNSQEESINMNVSFSQDNSLQSEVEIEMDTIFTKIHA
ncbi:12283_t:CDS:2, partial [Cetraspora pellucida]